MLTLIVLALALVEPLPRSSETVTINQAAVVIGTSDLGYPAGEPAFDPSGNLWVADLQNSRVLEFMAPFRSDMNASILLGQTDFHSWFSGWFANEMTNPSSVTFDRTGNLWVADSGNDRVTEFTPPFHNGMNASLVIGQKAAAIPNYPLPDWSSTVAATSRNGLAAPDGIVFDSFGDLWVVDSWNGRVLEFVPPFSNNMNASLVIGEQDFTASCNPETRNDSLTLCGDRRTLSVPMAVGFDATGNLWVTDTINLGTYATPQYQGRLLEFTPPFNDGMQAALVIRVTAGSSSVAFDSTGNLWLVCAACMSNGRGYVSEYQPPFSDSMKPLLTIGTITNLTGETVTNPTGLSFDSAGNLWVVDSNRILGFSNKVHSVLTSYGRAHFENDLGLLAPLSYIPTANVGSISFPEGLFNFTIQGLPPRGSVKLTITFPSALPSGVGWVNVTNGNPLGNGTVKWSPLPASQVQVNGNKMILTLTNTSQEGVISVMGGPALSSLTTASASPTNSTRLPSPGLPSNLIPVALVIVVVWIALVIYRKRHVART